MVTKTTGVTPPRLAPLFPQSRFGDGILIISYLNQRDIACAQRVCTTWNRHYLLSDGKREDARCVREGYPEQMVKAFRAKGFSLWSLPELGMAGRKDQNLSIWFWPDSLKTCAVVRFKTDTGCVGLALRIEGHGKGEFTVHNKLVRPIDGFATDLTLYRHKEHGYWTFDQARGNDVERAYWALHQPHHKPSPHGSSSLDEYRYICPTCPSFLSGDTVGIVKFVERMVANRDPVFHLRGQICMVDKPKPLPEYVPEQETSFCSTLATWASAICSCGWKSLSSSTS